MHLRVLILKTSQIEIPKHTTHAKMSISEFRPSQFVKSEISHNFQKKNHHQSTNTIAVHNHHHISTINFFDARQINRRTAIRTSTLFPSIIAGFFLFYIIHLRHFFGQSDRSFLRSETFPSFGFVRDLSRKVCDICSRGRIHYSHREFGDRIFLCESGSKFLFL